MAVTNALRSDQDLTRGLIEEIAGGELGAKLRSQVATWHPGVNRDEVDEAFQEACLRAQGRCRGQTQGEVFTWLRTTTFRHATAWHPELGRIVTDVRRVQETLRGLVEDCLATRLRNLHRRFVKGRCGDALAPP